ncbi:MAG: hypothetical protein MUC97_15810 [Bernardetiaceae bacterium]|jgi:hypothetical protein|nr:hypothetical protein [Bernardetiaceae bacterium]
MEPPKPPSTALGLGWKENLKLAAQAGWVTARSLLGIFLLGILLNWGFALVMLFASAAITELVTLIILGFALLVPIVYFLVGKAYGVRSGLSYVLNRKKAGFIEFLLQKMLQAGAEKTLNYEKLKTLLAKPARWLGLLPRWVRAIAGYFISQVPFADILLEATKGQEVNAENLSAVSQAMAEKIDEKTELLAPNPLPLWILLGANALLMGLAWVYGR